jgi:ABC-type branched-subunit amino acid transport system permease subunit
MTGVPARLDAPRDRPTRSPGPVQRTGFAAWVRTDSAKRLVGCLGLGVGLALMTGETGIQSDYWFALKRDLLTPSILGWLAVGLGVWALLSFWTVMARYVNRPGALGLLSGVLTVIVAMTVLHWFDPQQYKFHQLASAAANTGGLSPLAKAFFAWLAWTQLVVVAVLSMAAIVLRNKILYAVAVVAGLGAAAIVSQSHKSVDQITHATDHATGVTVAVWGYCTIAAAMAVAGLTKDDIAHTRDFVNRVLGWRPGFAVAAAAVLLGLYSLALSSWFDPRGANATLRDVHTIFRGTGLAPIAVQYFIWLSWALVLSSGAVTLAGSYLRSRAIGLLGAILGAAGLIITMLSIHAITKLAADKGGAYNTAGPWQNLGDGAWWTCAAFVGIAGGGLVVAFARRPKIAGAAQTAAARSADGSALAGESDLTEDAAPAQPPAAVDPSTGGRRFLYAPGASMSLLVAVAAAALFVPPTLLPSWQSALVTSIGIYVFLAIGLNVVVGWAGLLDLGFIAFYAIGAYVTAYFVGSLPVSPPFHVPVLWAIPFAVVACLIAGVILGFPTLRLRGDYLAIVTLGFGEIVQLAANNASSITNGPRGTEHQVPHPTINLGVVKFKLGLDQLPYWYLLLIAIVIVVVLFRRLESSRTGRAWAAIREDEVAAQAAGINPVKYKLMAFAIGASTSGLAGVLYAANVGFFNPTNFRYQISILVLAYVVFGGMGSLPGAIAGAAVLTWLPEFLKDVVPSEDRQMYIGAVLVLMMMFRPAGLIPARRRDTELHMNTSDSEPRAVPAGGGLGGAA